MFTSILSAGEFFVGTFWAFVPAIVAIALALITKQVYLSLFAGIFVGSMFLFNGEPLAAFQHVFETMASQLGNNGGILIFLVVLGIFAVLMVKSGGSTAYGNWAASKIKGKTGAQLATVAFGCLIFVDDYFNCLTVGSVMRPVTDKYRVSRAKLAYLIDSTAAPICIIAPISSWAAAVAGYGDGGITAFIKTIPFNVYALMTIVMMVTFILLKTEFFKMKRNEKAAANGDLHAGETDLPTEDVASAENKKGKVANLLIPIIVLIICCVSCMIYNGWSYLHTLSSEELLIELGKDGFNVLDMFSQCDSSIALATGSVIALIITIIYYAAAKVMNFKDIMSSITEGFKSMVPAILILTFAWTLCALMGAKGAGLVDGAPVLDGTLNAKAFIQSVISADSMVLGIIPFVFFILACFISFATGTSWGTFGTLLPIAIAVMPEQNAAIYYLTLSAVLAGAVYGDHVSPISDTTIMASSGAQCNHIDHVRTQFPYATIVAVVSALTYLIGGFTSLKVNSYGAMVAITLAVAVVLMAVIITTLYFLDKSGKADKLEALFKNLFKGKKNSTLAAETAAADGLTDGNEIPETIEQPQGDDDSNGTDEQRQDTGVEELETKD